jgi:adenine-specific DNA methylase
MSQAVLANSELKERQKHLGVFYTDRTIAEFLLRWSIRDRNEKVLDPSFGGGVFLESAAERLLEVGGVPRKQIFGVEIDEDVYQRVAEDLQGRFGIGRENLVRSDFFGIHSEFIPRMSVVLGNPPFIRFHRFAGTMRRRAQRRANEAGINLSELSSSWAAFVVHSTAFLRKGGRLAMVVPYEICQAAYAQPVLRHLSQCFAEVTILTFREKLFPDLNENTALLLADRYGHEQVASFYWQDFAGPQDLAELAWQGVTGMRIALDAGKMLHGVHRFSENLIPATARDIYQRLLCDKDIVRLRDIADVGIGYVTGANEYFHLSPEEAARRAIPSKFLRKAVRRGRSISNLKLTEEDWNAALDTEECAYLLLIPPSARLPKSVEEYLDEGRRIGIPNRYKCRNRIAWFSVPHVSVPDLFLSYMSGRQARITANMIGAVAPNSLHNVKLHPLCRYTAVGVAALWQTSLTRLSSETEGHSLGGGMLKLEPSEAEAVALAFPNVSASRLEEIAERLDSLARRGCVEQVQRTADELILQREFGLSRQECSNLFEAAEALSARRMFKSKSYLCL